MKLKSKIILLQTSKSNIAFVKNFPHSDKLVYSDKIMKLGVLDYVSPTHLYFGVDQDVDIPFTKIHKGDWIIVGNNAHRCVMFQNTLGYYLDSNFMFIQPHFQKIVATTNTNFISDAPLNIIEPSKELILEFIDRYNQNKQFDCFIELDKISTHKVNLISDTKYEPVNVVMGGADLKDFCVKNPDIKEEIKKLFARYNEFIAHNDPDTWDEWITKNL